MRLERLIVKNWKNFEYAEIAVKDRLALFGPNAAGKSNLLDALSFLHDATYSIRAAVNKRGGVPAIRALAALGNPDVTIVVHLATTDHHRWRYEIAFNQSKNGQVRLSAERVALDDATMLNRPNPDDRADPARLTQTHLEQTSANASFRPIVAFFRSIKRFTLSPQQARSRSDALPLLTEMAESPDDIRRERLARITTALQPAVPHLADLNFSIDAAGRPHLQAFFRNWRKKQARHQEDQLSDGALRLIGMLWSALASDGPILIEEPESYLHPSIARALPALLQGMTHHQIFITTHAPALLEAFAPDEVALIIPRQGNVANAAADPTIAHLRSCGLSLAEIAVSLTTPEGIARIPTILDDLDDESLQPSQNIPPGLSYPR